jgi:hypothetical protein
MASLGLSGSGVVLGLSTVPACQSFFDPGIAAPAPRQPHPAFQPPSCRPGGAATSFRWQPHSLAHRPGQIHMMGRGHSSPLHFGGELRHRPDPRLGRMLRCPGADYLRLWPAVLFFSLGRAYTPPGRENAFHHSLPPPIKWSGGAVPPPPKGLFTGAVSGRGLARSPALGVARAPSRPS